jgi:hypothetical protein
MNNWISCEHNLPPNGTEVMTKVDDHRGCRNEQSLKRQNNLWFYPDMSMYVYYTPTHWKSL